MEEVQGLALGGGRVRELRRCGLKKMKFFRKGLWTERRNTGKFSEEFCLLGEEVLAVGTSLFGD